jgi:spore coat polysaccharide biosynthesis protein SpsF
MARRVVGVLLARMGSHRFPGKILSKIAGLEILELIVSRLQYKFGTSLTITLATTCESSDDQLVERAKSIGLHVSRGSTHDVLLRAIEAAESVGGTHLLRLNGDCPLVEPLLIGRGLEALQNSDAEVVTSRGQTNLPYGISTEICSVERLRRLHPLSTEVEKEHMFNVVYRLTPARLIHRIGFDFPPRPELRLTVDFPIDSLQISELIRISGCEPISLHYWDFPGISPTLAS